MLRLGYDTYSIRQTYYSNEYYLHQGFIDICLFNLSLIYVKIIRIKSSYIHTNF